MPELQEIWVQFLGWEDPLEKEMEPTAVFLPGESHGQRSLVGTVHGITRPSGCAHTPSSVQATTLALLAGVH